MLPIFQHFLTTSQNNNNNWGKKMLRCYCSPWVYNPSSEEVTKLKISFSSSSFSPFLLHSPPPLPPSQNRRDKAQQECKQAGWTVTEHLVRMWFTSWLSWLVPAVYNILILNIQQRPCVEDMVISLWHFWEGVDGGKGQWQEVIGVCLEGIIGNLILPSPCLSSAIWVGHFHHALQSKSSTLPQDQKQYK